MAYRPTFISYPHADAALARQLAGLLAGSGVPVWFDEWELNSDLRGAALNDALSSAIREVDAMVVLETESYRQRKAQNVPGATLAHATARPEGPLHDAPIIGHEESAWIITRDPERILFKSVLLRMTTRPGRPLVLPLAEETRVIERTVPHDDLPLTPRRRAVYRHRVTNYWGDPYVAWMSVDWPENASPRPPQLMEDYYDTLIGEEVHFGANNLHMALPVLLHELRPTVSS